MTVRILSDLLGRVSNTRHGNEAQDIRDLLTTAGVYARWPDIARPDDTYWLGSDYDDDFTQVTVSGNQTVTESTGVLSVRFAAQNSGDYNAAVKPFNFTIGDAWAVPLGLFALRGGASGGQEIGIVFSDGTNTTSNIVIGTILWSDGAGTNFQLVGREGTFTTIATSPWVSNDVVVATMLPFVVVRLTYSAANTFTLEFSGDGVTFTDFAEADISQVMIPTHVGVCWTESTGQPEALATFGPLRYTPS